MTAKLDQSRLDGVRRGPKGVTARCPACAECGGDKKSEHLFIDAAGRFGCVVNPGPDGANHRKRIFALVGLTDEPAKSVASHGIQDVASKLAARVGGTVGGTWIYRDQSGKPALAVVRVNLPSGGKTYRPLKMTGDGWRVGDPQGLLPLYALPALQSDPSAIVYCCEGEKCADAARSLGLLATTSAHGAKSAHKTDWMPLAGRSVVLLPDCDADGRAYADKVRDHLTKLNPPARVRVVNLPDLGVGGDIADYVEDQLKRGIAVAKVRREIERLTAESAAATPKGNLLASISASALADMDLPSPIWFVPGLLPQGATLLCGKPKCGKSWMSLALGCAVASGGVFLSKYQCEHHEVLYLALEDTKRRLKDRLARMLHGQRPPSGLHLVTECPRMPEGLPALESYLDERPLVRLLIVDTLQRFRPPSGFKGVYEGDYDAITPLKQLVDRRGMALLIVHHVRKAAADDVFETVSGSHGLTGAVDAMLILKRNREERDGALHGTGRDLEDVELPVRFNADGNWAVLEGGVPPI